MKCVFLAALVVRLLSADTVGLLCPDIQLETEAGQPFEANISITNCISMCEGVVCVLNVSELENYTLSITDCFTIQVKGEADAGETTLSFKYEFTCDIFPTTVVTADAFLLLRGIDMELLLRKQWERSVMKTGSTVELSCFSHLNDSRDIPFSFSLVSDNRTITAYCPVYSNSSVNCVSPIEGRDWEVCRNETTPHNCILLVHNFDDPDGGNYSCSTKIAGKDVNSNMIQLHALGNLEPAETPKESSKSSNKLALGLGVGIGTFLVVMVVVFIVLSVVKSRQTAANDQYQRLSQDQQSDAEIYTPRTGTPNQESSSVNTGAAGEGGGGAAREPVQDPLNENFVSLMTHSLEESSRNSPHTSGTHPQTD